MCKDLSTRKDGETVDDYVAELKKKIVQHCEYGATLPKNSVGQTHLWSERRPTAETTAIRSGVNI